ncbi:hypothetical protein EDC01DRAFT_781737 [Geopyxis carbonaria]|nr:hypothetical protein EDC01DRAFT_781737 [Geopyxis carbonaria]
MSSAPYRQAGTGDNKAGETAYGQALEGAYQETQADGGVGIIGTASTTDDTGRTHSRSNLNYAYPLRPGSQQMPGRTSQPMGHDGSRRLAGPQSGGGGPPPRPPRPKYVPSTQEPFETEAEPRPAVAYRGVEQPVRPHPRRSSSSEENDTISSGTHPSMDSDRSIYIGFDTSNASSSPRGTGSLGIPSFPAVPPGASQQRRGSGSAPPPPPSSRRVASAYYSQNIMMVSPIPEESGSSRHGSYASSAAIPPNWAPSIRELESGESDTDGARYPAETHGDHGHGLVRQASLGRKSKPTLTNIKGPEKSRSGTSSDGSTNSAGSQVRSPGIAMPQATVSTGNIPKQGYSPVSSNSSPLTQLPQAALRDSYFSEKPREGRRTSDTRMSLSMAKEIGLAASEPLGNQRKSSLGLAAAGGSKGLMPEARGSLTSLPDLIRRATKLAAVLETGRPDSRWGGRGSWFDRGSSSRSNARDTDSISDILASFPPPVLAQPNQPRSPRTAAWPLADDAPGSLRHMRTGRRICGLPLWAFILLVLLALVVITAAVVVPLQLVNLSKTAAPGAAANLVARCKAEHPCMNGGENIATAGFCGCVCTNGFTGASCAGREDDRSCASFDFEDRTRASGDTVEGIRNATIGSALPRLLDKAEDAYAVALDPARLLAVFAAANLSCTLQNALVSFNGKTQPTKRSLHALDKRQLAVDTSTPPSATTTSAAPTATSTAAAGREPALDQDAVDFARVGVLYVAQTQSMAAAEAAQEALNDAFRAGTDWGNVTSADTTFVLDERSIVVPGGKVVGGVPANSTDTADTATKARRWYERDAYS